MSSLTNNRLDLDQTPADRSPLLRFDSQPCESEDSPTDIEQSWEREPLVTPDALASAAIVLACIVAAVVVAAWCWVTA
jgi:hypothetical protein